MTSWTGGVKNHLIISDDSDSDFHDTEWEMEYSDDEMDDLEREELIESTDEFPSCLQDSLIDLG